MDSESHEQLESLSLSDFFRVNDGDSTFISGSYTPDSLTPTRQVYEVFGAACLQAQLENAWLNDDDVAAREIMALIDSIPKAIE